MPEPAPKPVPKPEPEPQKPGGGGDEEANPLKGAEIAHTWAKWVAIGVLLGGLLYCLLGAGLLGWSHEVPFQADVNFALFAAFIVIAGAIERFLEPTLVVLPPYEKKTEAKMSDEEKAAVKEANERARADRALLAYAIALLVGIAVCSVFGFYFLETMGVKVGSAVGSGEAAGWSFANDGEKVLRGLDVFITALIITGGTKPLHDMITSIEKKKESLTGAASNSA